MMNTKTTAKPRRFVPAQRLHGLTPYMPPVKSPFVSLSLDANEGPNPSDTLLEVLSSMDPDQLRRYPSTAELEALLASRFGITAERVVVTNGADDAIDRVCRVALEPGREILVHTPTFEMIERCAQLAGGSTRVIGWHNGAFPVDAAVERISESTSLVSLVSPNNPTGGAITLDEMLEVVRAAAVVGAIVMVDLAYVEFADEDPTGVLLEEPNVVIVRTFSKAMGLAGARVGYTLASTEISNWLRTVGGPYPVSSASVAVAAVSLGEELRRGEYIGAVRSEREALTSLLTQLGCDVMESQANFVTARFADGTLMQRALVALGISVRAFSGPTELSGCLRITLPGSAADYVRLRDAILTILKPEAVLFDLDGVLADVSQSYRACILETARSFGVELTLDDIGNAKRAGNANNDWDLTKRLIEQHGVVCELDEVVSRFQRFYEGSPVSQGSRETERLLVDPADLQRLREKYLLGIVTGRPRDEAEWFLNRAGIRELFSSLVCMEDEPLKPSPEPVQRAIDELGVNRAWMIGDTPDDIVAARLARVVPIGIVAPGEDPYPASDAMLRAGAVSVMSDLSEFEGIIR